MTNALFCDKVARRGRGTGGERRGFRHKKRAEPLVEGRELIPSKPCPFCERMPEVEREYTANDPLKTPGFEALSKYLLQRKETPTGQGQNFEEHEKELHRLMATCATELVSDAFVRRPCPPRRRCEVHHGRRRPLPPGDSRRADIRGPGRTHASGEESLPASRRRPFDLPAGVQSRHRRRHLDTTCRTDHGDHGGRSSAKRRREHHC
jgi:hypothetical protein